MADWIEIEIRKFERLVIGWTKEMVGIAVIGASKAL